MNLLSRAIRALLYLYKYCTIPRRMHVRFMCRTRFSRNQTFGGIVMKVTNDASFAVIAFGTHNKKGYGVDVRIPAGQSAEVNGPYLGEMGGGSCHVALIGEVTCQETPDDNKGLQVTRGKPL